MGVGETGLGREHGPRRLRLLGVDGRQRCGLESWTGPTMGPATLSRSAEATVELRTEVEVDVTVELTPP